MFVLGTQGQFEPKYRDKFVVDYPWKLKDYHLSYYIPRELRGETRAGSSDTESVEELK